MNVLPFLGRLPIDYLVFAAKDENPYSYPVCSRSFRLFLGSLSNDDGYDNDNDNDNGKKALGLY